MYVEPKYVGHRDTGQIPLWIRDGNVMSSSPGLTISIGLCHWAIKLFLPLQVVSSFSSRQWTIAYVESVIWYSPTRIMYFSEEYVGGVYACEMDTTKTVNLETLKFWTLIVWLQS